MNTALYLQVRNKRARIGVCKSCEAFAELTIALSISEYARALFQTVTVVLVCFNCSCQYAQGRPTIFVGLL